jgi:pimeloyl-ACP methyl ester carboxylesterase
MATDVVDAQVEVAGLDTHYVRAGHRGPAIVVLHGGAPGACAMVNWGSNIVPLADAGFDVIAFDQPGYGGTANPEDYSMDFRVAHAKAFIGAMGLARFHVMANSQGSYLAARIALDDARVDRLVLVSSGTLAPAGSPEAQAIARQHGQDLGSYEPGLENMRRLSQGTLFRKELVTEEFVRLRYEMSIGRLHEASNARRNAPRPNPITAELVNLRPYTLLLSGLHDAGVPLERTQLLFSLLPHAEWHVFSDAAHWVQWDQAARFNSLVADFLGSATD